MRTVVRWGEQTGPNPTDRAKLGSKRHLICDGRGVPLAVQLTGANRNDSQQALALVDAIPLLQGGRGGRAIARIASWATVVMTPKQSGKACEFAGLDLGSPSETSNMAVDWVDGGG
jgi:hypothetical protein